MPVRQKSAFSLVELSIVLVILGLLVGGVLSGQSLIRASELRAITTEYSKYIAATHTFRDKYFALPGDMNNSTQFWGRLNGNADCVTNSGAAVSASAGACDGNGDGNINAASAAGKAGELCLYWRELALAGIIEGSYTGISGPATGNDIIPGTNAPMSRMSNVGWGVFYLGNYGGDISTYAYNYLNTFGVGTITSGNIPEGWAFKPEEAWNIDTKIDDGKPGTGKLMARDSYGFGNAGGCTTSANSTDYTGGYNLSQTAFSCSLLFPNVF